MRVHTGSTSESLDMSMENPGASSHSTIKAIGEAARRDITDIAGAKVHLFLFVKVRENWGDDPERYRAMGLEFPKE